MNKIYKVVVTLGKDGPQRILDLQQGAGDKGQAVRLKAEAGARYLVQEITPTKNTAPENLKVRRVGKDLQVIFENDDTPSLIVEDYYQVMPADYNGLVGQAENGAFYEYIPEDPEIGGLVQMLPENGEAVNMALGVAEVSGVAAALPAAPLLALGPLLGLGAAGAAALWTLRDKGTASTPPKVAISSDKVNLDEGEKAVITFKLSEPSADFSAEDITVKGGKLGPLKQSATDPLIYTAELTPDKGASSVALAVGSQRFTNAAGQANEDGGEADNALSLSVTCDPIGTTSDTTPPTVAISRSGSNTVQAGGTETITFTLSEASSTFALDDVTVVGGKLSNFQKSTSNPLVYTAIFTAEAGSKGQATIGVAAGKFTDTTGNLNIDTYVPGAGFEANNLLTLEVDASALGATGAFALAGGQTAPAGLLTAQTQAVNALKTYLGQPDVLAKLFANFNGTLAAPTAAWNTAANDFLTAFQADQATARIELRSGQELKNVQAAFSPVGTTGQPTIYLNADWLATNPGDSAIARVLLEEYGHYIDSRINASDTVGDEGQLFSYRVLGLNTTPEQLAAISQEDDRISLVIDGQTVLVEAVSLLFSREAYFTSTPITLEQNVMTLGARLPGVKFLFVSDPPTAPYYSGNNVRGYLYGVDADNNVVSSHYGEISRLVKTGSTLDGCQFYVYPNPASPSTGTASTTIVFGITTTFDNSFATGSVVKTSSDPVSTALNSLITPNKAPVASPDSGTATMPSCSVAGQVLANATGTVLANDTDSDTQYTISGNKMVPVPGAGMTVTNVISSATNASAVVASGTTSSTGAVLNGRYGSLTLGSDGTYVYDVNELLPALTALPQGSTVTESFTYTVSDGQGGTATSTLTITITGGNNAPAAVNDFQAVAEVAVNALQATGNVKSNDTEPDTGDSFSVISASTGQTLSATPTTITAAGAATISGTAAYTYATVTFQNGQQTSLVGYQVYKSGSPTGIFLASVGGSGGKTMTFKDASGAAASLATTLTDTLSFVSGTNTVAAGPITTLSSPDTTRFFVNNASGTITVGGTITGEGIAAGTTVTAVNGNYITLSTAATLGSTSTTLSSGDNLSIQSGVIYGQYGYINLKSDGTYQYFLTTNVPSNTLVNDYFSYKIQDANGCSSTAVLQIQIQGDQVNPPTGNADTANVNESSTSSGGTPITGNVLSNDTGGVSPLSLASAWTVGTASSPTSISAGTTLVGTYGTLTLNPDGSYSYAVNNANSTVDALRLNSETLTETFYYRVKDSQSTAAFGTSTLTITIRGVNDAPVAVNDTATAIEASGLNNTTAGFNPTGNVLLNDTDVDSGDSKTVTAIAGGTLGAATTGTYGTLTLNADGSYSYVVNNSNPTVEALKSNSTPLTDTFSYTLTDTAGATSTATLTVTIRGADDTVYAPDIYVNEGSSHAVFSVQSGAGQQLSLSLAAGTATAGTDYTNSLQYWNGTAWISYTSGDVTVPADGVLLVRVAITNDTLADNAETFTLTATNKGGTAFTATATILDDGTGTLFTSASPVTINGVTTPAEDTTTLLNDDRPLSVNSVTVNEASPYIVFQVTGASEQYVSLSNTAVTASSADYGPQWQYFDGNSWVNYTAGSHVQIPATGTTLLVRTAVVQDALSDNGETFTLTATNTGGSGANGTGTIKDDGTGDYFAADNLTGTPGLPPGTVLDDDRPLTVNSLTVNEGSPYAVFTVGGVASQPLTLSLAAGTATAGADYTDSLEYWNGTAWVSYSTGAQINIPAGASNLLVRVAITNDTVADNGETFTLTATNTGGTGTAGTATIKDDGTGTLFTAANPTTTAGVATPAVDTTTTLNDDRPLAVNNLSVNEGSPYATFTVTAASGQLVKLALANGSASLASATPVLDGSMDYGPALEYWNGTAWTAYTANSFVAVPTGASSLLVRTAIVNDTAADNNQTFTLTATNTGGAAAVGTGTIKDDGTGDWFAANNNTGTPALPANTVLNEDRFVQVSDIQVNEGSPYAIFKVTGSSLSPLNLGLAAGTAGLGTDTAAANTLEWFIGGVWTSSGSPVLDANGELLVRLAVNNDSTYEGPETFTLTAAIGPVSATGTATILDDGSGNIYPASAVTSNPDPNAQRDDDRAVQVNNLQVNEGSPFAVFTVEAPPGVYVKLGLQSDSTAATRDAVLGTDAGTALEYYNGSWVSYTPGSAVQMPSTGTLLVRTAVTNDMVYEGSETFQLSAVISNSSGVSTGMTSVGTATILDDGTGAIYPNNTSGNPDPDAKPDDDRQVQVNNLTVNEGSPFAVFTVSGTPQQSVSLNVASGLAVLGMDTLSSTLEWFDGTQWTSTGTPTIQANGQLLVRVALKDDAVYEGPETFTLNAIIGAASSTGTATIVDDGSGSIYPDNTTGNPDPDAVRNDDRAVQVNDIAVNEDSPYAVFTVKPAAGSANTYVKLSLQNDNDPLLADAVLGTDTGAVLQYFDGSGWVNYAAGTVVLLPTTGLLVRTAVTDDSVYEGAEAFQLKAQVTNSSGSSTGMSSYGTATILDDGTGSIYPDNTTGNPDPDAKLDDDRQVQVNNLLVNEGSPYAVFTVTAPASTWLKLDLLSDNDPNTANAALGVDTAAAGAGVPMQYYNGNAWVNYTPGSVVQAPSTGTLLVRTAITNDSVYEGPENFQLSATVASSAGTTTGMTAYGTATIVDDGSGSIYPDNTTGAENPTAPRDDDRIVKINDVQVNEASPYAVFTLTGPAGTAPTYVKLELQNDSDIGTANAALGTDTANAGAGVPLQYFNGSDWLDYVPGSVVALPVTGLLVRTAITDDSIYEGPETFQIKATVTNSAGTLQGASSYGTGTIKDDGTGDWFAPTNNTGTPSLPAGAVLSDDRVLSVNSIAVNEGSPFAIFTVEGLEGQALRLSLAGVTATAGLDYTNALEYWNGTTWTPYSAGGLISIPSDGDSTSNEKANLLVRVAITNDTLSDSGETFTLTATRTDNRSATGVATIKDDGTGAYFAPGNTTGVPLLPAGTSLDNDQDRTAPTIAITSNKSALSAGETAQITFTLSETSLDFRLSDITVSGGSLSNFTGSGTRYTATYTAGLATGSRTVFVGNNAFSDVAGNFNQDASEANNRVSMDGSVQTPTIVVSSTKGQLNAGETALVNFTLSQPSTDFGLEDVTVVGGKLSNFQGSGTSYSATFTPTSCSTNGFVVVSSNKFSNSSGVFNQDGLEANNAVAFNSVAADSDQSAPTVAIVSDARSVLQGESTRITFLLSHNSTDFAQEDILVVGGTLSDFKGAGALYTATFTPAAGATSAMVFVDSDKFRSAAGVANQDGLDTNNILSLLIGSHGCEDVTTLGLEDVLAVPPSACLGQYVLKVEGDANDVVNLKRSGTGGDQWTASGMVTVDNQLYQLWTHSANSKAFVLIDADIHTVVPNMV